MQFLVGLVVIRLDSQSNDPGSNPSLVNFIEFLTLIFLKLKIKVYGEINLDKTAIYVNCSAYFYTLEPIVQ